MSKIVVTHAGGFGASEVLCLLVLRSLGFVKHLIRTDDPKLIDSAEIAFYAGHRYDPGLGRFDHRGAHAVGVRPNKVPYATAGLLWLEYGKPFCRRDAKKYDVRVEELADAVDTALFQGVDAIEREAVSSVLAPQKSDSSHHIHIQNFWALVRAFNPIRSVEETHPRAFDAAFLRAADAVWPFFERIVLTEIGYLKALKARD